MEYSIAFDSSEGSREVADRPGSYVLWGEISAVVYREPEIAPTVNNIQREGGRAAN